MAHVKGTQLEHEDAITAESFQWDDAPTDLFLEFILRNAKPDFSGSLALSKDPAEDNGMPQAFQDHVAGLFDEQMNFPVNEWRYWFGVTLPEVYNEKDRDFAKGFPHAHNWLGLTAIHYVQVPEEGGDLVIVDWREHKVLHRFTPKVGMTVIVDGYSLHGVTPVHGSVPRLSLIATGFHAQQDNALRRRAGGRVR